MYLLSNHSRFEIFKRNVGNEVLDSNTSFKAVV